MVTGDQKTLFAADFAHAESCGIGDVLKLFAAEFALRKRSTRSDWQKLFRSDFSIVKRIHRDSVAGAPRLLTEWIGKGCDGSIQVFSVQAESEPEEIGLPRVIIQARIRKVGEVIGSDIQDRERLIRVFVVSVIRTESAVQEDHKAPVRRNCRSRRQIIDLAWLARNLPKQPPVWQLHREPRILRRKLNR